nr:serine/threonine-protein kinase [Pleionea sp. CnH1-48]
MGKPDDESPEIPEENPAAKKAAPEPKPSSNSTATKAPAKKKRSNYAHDRRKARPKNIGRYKILEELGRGAMAYVYKAYDPEIDRFLAVKVLREELANDDDYRSGFLREAKLAGQLAHPGIVTVYDVGVADDKPYIAMELLDGIPLDKLLKKRSQLPLPFVVSIVIQIARALHYAHKQGVIHRDIKPGNIMCLADHKTFKITDFGIAQLDDSLSPKGKTPDKVLGTPEYMAPEQVLGQQADARSDLYALGILIFAMLTGSTPFRADDFGELFRQIVKDKAPSLNITGVHFPDEIQDIVRKLLQKQPDKRYQSAALLMRDLRDLVEVMERDDKENRRPGFVSLRIKWTLMMASLVASTMFVGLLVVYFQQYMAMRNMALDYGYSISRMIAFEVAEPLLLDDQVALETIVKDLKSNQEVEYVSIRNHENKIIASTSGNEKNKNFAAFPNAEVYDKSGAATFYSREISSDHQVFDIDSAITYQNRHLGNVWVTVSADKLVRSSKITLVIMIVLMIVTLIAVFSMTLAFARQISKQSKRIVMALDRVRNGQFNRRLTVEKNDEFGRINYTFNLMAETLEKRYEKSASRLSGDTENLRVKTMSGIDADVNDDDDATVVLEKDF